MVAYINLACYYVVGLPLGYLLGYVADLGVMVVYHFFCFGLHYYNQHTIMNFECQINLGALGRHNCWNWIADTSAHTPNL